MADILATLVFYLFSGITVLSALMVISSKNPVHSVFFLILAFFNSAGLFVLLGAEFIAMILVIVYVGAVAVLFLFVVMMLDIDFAELRAGFLKHLPMGLGTALLIFFELFIVLYVSLGAPEHIVAAAHTIPASVDTANTNAIGNILYTWYLLPFQMAGIILLIAMIGAIVLTHRTRMGLRKQSIAVQNQRDARDCMEIVKVKSGEGIA